MKKYYFFVALFLSCLLLLPLAQAQDISIDESGISIPADIIEGETVRIYATVQNNSTQDLTGTVKFYDETKQSFIGADQPVSIVAGKTDDVFVDMLAEDLGDHVIAVRIVPWEETGDNPDNNKVSTTLYVDADSDGDGIGNRTDDDDDNDGIKDVHDVFPLDPSETNDVDGDGIGDNVDQDDDNDGVSDIEDAFPLDETETLDSDGDGVGDNADAFPLDETEALDSDGDGVGDNSDYDKNNHGPIPVIETKDTLTPTGEFMTFSALKSRDPDGNIVSYEWDFGDGLKEEGVVVDHAFKNRGDYRVVLKTVDDKGETKEETLRIMVTWKWQTLFFFVVTLLLILLLIGYRFIFGGKKRSEKRKRLEKELEELQHSVKTARISQKKKTIVSPKKKKETKKD